MTENAVKKARALRKSSGILADPITKKGRILSDEVKTKVLEFYEDDNYSRMCPGIKDYLHLYQNYSRKASETKEIIAGKLEGTLYRFQVQHLREYWFFKVL